MVEHFRNTTVTSLDGFIKRVKFDLNLFAGKSSFEDSLESAAGFVEGGSGSTRTIY